jgi:hypothetical protein
MWQSAWQDARVERVHGFASARKKPRRSRGFKIITFQREPSTPAGRATYDARFCHSRHQVAADADPTPLPSSVDCITLHPSLSFRYTQGCLEAKRQETERQRQETERKEKEVRTEIRGCVMTARSLRAAIKLRSFIETGETKRGFRLVNERRHDRGGWLYVANEIDAFTREDY